MNNSNLYGRTWQVNIEGEAENRRDVDDIWRDQGAQQDGRHGAAALDRQPAFVVGPQVITHYNDYRLDEHQRQPRSRQTSGAALRAMARISAAHAAAGLRLRMDRHRLPGARGERPDRADPRHGGGVRLPVPGGAVRELDDPVAGAALGGDRCPRRLAAASWSQARRRPLRPDRPRRADRARRQERHPDRRVRQGAARGRHADRRCRRARRPHALPLGHDDVVRLHPRPGAAGVRARRRADQPPRHRHIGFLGHAGGDHAGHLPDPDALRGVPAHPRMGRFSLRRRRHSPPHRAVRNGKVPAQRGEGSTARVHEPSRRRRTAAPPLGDSAKGR